MAKETVKKVQTDEDVKRKAIKLVIAHLRKKIAVDYRGKDSMEAWLEEMDELLAKPEFILSEYIAMRREFNDIIERTMDEEMRFKLRDSWYSLGRAMDKKAKQR